MLVESEPLRMMAKTTRAKRTWTIWKQCAYKCNKMATKTSGKMTKFMSWMRSNISSC